MGTDTMRVYRATPKELRDILGTRWAICRKTPRNVERYGNCITKLEYNRAAKLALEKRKENDKPSW